MTDQEARNIAFALGIVAAFHVAESIAILDAAVVLLDGRDAYYRQGYDDALKAVASNGL